jgi:hypothetical protein
MRSAIAKMAKKKSASRQGLAMFYADVKFSADVMSTEHPLRLVVADSVDGWLAAVVYPDTKESITLAQEPKIEDAKAHVEGWVRVVHNVSDVIEWIPGPPPTWGLGAKS